MRKFWLIALLSVLRIFPAAAYDITITAEKRVEVYQDEKKAVAVGNAVAVKPGMTVKGERLTAYFTQTGGENGEKKTSVTDMTAEQNVSLHMEKADAFGERMEYHVKDDYMVIKGKPALIKNDKAKITADGNITYYPGRNKAVARDNVIAENLFRSDGNIFQKRRGRQPGIAAGGNSAKPENRHPRRHGNGQNRHILSRQRQSLSL